MTGPSRAGIYWKLTFDKNSLFDCGSVEKMSLCVKCELATKYAGLEIRCIGGVVNGYKRGAQRICSPV